MTGANVPGRAGIDMYTRGATCQRIILTEFVVGVIAMVGGFGVWVLAASGAGALLRAAPRRRSITLSSGQTVG